MEKWAIEKAIVLAPKYDDNSTNPDPYNTFCAISNICYTFYLLYMSEIYFFDGENYIYDKNCIQTSMFSHASVDENSKNWCEILFDSIFNILFYKHFQ